MHPDGTPEGVKRSIDNCLRILDGKKKIDIFECARVDKHTPIETTMKALEEHVKQGDIGGICLSEVSAATIERAVLVTKIVGVEVEFSLWSLDPLSNGVAAACAKYDIPLIAYVQVLPLTAPDTNKNHRYSPIGRGILTGEIKSPTDLPEGDFRRGYPRFSEENFPKNLELVHQLENIAREKGCSAAQLAIAWVKQQSRKNGNPEVIPIPGATSVSRVDENSKAIQLSPAELSQIDQVLSSFEVTGERYPEALMAHANG
jgi:pyridoxine 4-dehydrogenase